MRRLDCDIVDRGLEFFDLLYVYCRGIGTTIKVQKIDSCDMPCRREVVQLKSKSHALVCI